MLVFMVQALQKPSFAFPVAQFLTKKVSGGMLYPLVWEVLDALELHGLQILAMISDGLSANRKFYHLSSNLTNDIPYMSNPHGSSTTGVEKELYFFCDVPHLMEMTRNCFSISYANSNTRALNVHMHLLFL